MSESVVTTSVSSATSQQAGAGGDRTQPPAAVEGRAGGKANRRRSRASRKAPTTVLNTDTANFRAMVQQYTGGPAVPFQAAYLCGVPGASATRRQYDDSGGPGGGSGGPGAGAALGYGLAAGPSTAQQLHHHHHHPVAFPAALGVQQQYYQQYAQYNLQQHHERPLFMPAGGTVDHGAGGSDDGYFPRLGSSNLQRDHMADHGPDGFLLERISSSQMMSRPAASTGDTAAGDGFFL